MFAIPDPSSLTRLPWQPEVGWLAADLWMAGREVAKCAARRAEAPDRGRRRAGLPPQDRRRVRVLHHRARRRRDRGRARYPGQALLRPVRPDAPLRGDHRDLRCDARARLGAVPERPRGRQRPVRDELDLRRRAGHRRPPRVLQVHGQDDRRAPRPARDLHAEAVRPSDRQRLPRARLALGPGRPQEPVRRRRRASSASRRSPTISSAACCTRPRRCARSSTRPSTATSASTRRPRSRARPGRRTRSATPATTAPTWCASPTPAASSSA